MTFIQLIETTSREVPQFALAGSFLEGLAAQDFGRLDLLCTGYRPENSSG